MLKVSTNQSIKLSIGGEIVANTPNYDLPLLDTSNIPSWLVGWNSAMTTIDLALDGLQEQIDGATGEPITVDSEFSETSENPVQNKVITAYLNQLTARVVALELGREIIITRQPVNTTAYTGGLFTFSVEAESGQPLTYLWYYKLSTDTDFQASSHTEPSFTATATSDVIGAVWEYKCKISNGTNDVWSNVATVTIVAQPQPNVTISLQRQVGNNYFIDVTLTNIPVPTHYISNYYGTANNIPQWIQGGNGTLSSQTQTVQCTTVASYNPTKLRVLVGENQKYVSNEISLT